MMNAIAILSVALFAILLIAAAYSDLAKYRISNSLVLGMLALFIPFALSNPNIVELHFHAAVALAVFAAGFVFFALRLMAGGDVKLFAVLGLWSGPALIIPFLIVASITGAVIGLFLVCNSRFGFAMAFDRMGFSRVPELLTNPKIPYGLALACGGLFVAWSYTAQLI